MQIFKLNADSQGQVEFTPGRAATLDANGKLTLARGEVLDLQRFSEQDIGLVRQGDNAVLFLPSQQMQGYDKLVIENFFAESHLTIDVSSEQTSHDAYVNAPSLKLRDGYLHPANLASKLTIPIELSSPQGSEIVLIGYETKLYLAHDEKLDLSKLNDPQLSQEGEHLFIDHEGAKLTVLNFMTPNSETTTSPQIFLSDQRAFTQTDIASELTQQIITPEATEITQDLTTVVSPSEQTFDAPQSTPVSSSETSSNQASTTDDRSSINLALDQNSTEGADDKDDFRDIPPVQEIYANVDTNSPLARVEEAPPILDESSQSEQSEEPSPAPAPAPTAVNQAPVNTLPSNQSMGENTVLALDFLSGKNILVTDVDAGSSILTVTISVDVGTITFLPVGITLHTGTGTADTSASFSGDLVSINSTLAFLNYTPPANFTGNATLTVTSHDNGNTGSGGTLTDTDSLTISVNPIVTTFSLTPGNDNFTVTVGQDDTFITTNANFAAVDTFDAMLGNDILRFTDDATVVTGQWSNKQGIDSIELLGANNSLALTDAFVASADGGFVTINHFNNAVYLDLNSIDTSTNQVMIAGSGLVTLSDTNNTIFASLGVNTNILGGSADDILVGSDGNDTLSSGGGQDNLYGGDGDDTLIASSGADNLTGDSGNDLFIWEVSTDATTLAVDVVTDYNQAGTDNLQFNFVDSLVLIGDTGSTEAWTNTAGEVIWYDDGTDTNLKIDFDGDGFADFHTVLQGVNDASTIGTDDVLVNVSHGSTGSDAIAGSSLDNQLSGGEGDDTIDGNGGNDTLTGGAGADTLRGGDGDDMITGDYALLDNALKAKMMVWLDATDMDSFGGTSDPIDANNTWVNKADTTNNAVQTNSADHASYSSTAIGGRGAFTFSGAQSFDIDLTALAGSSYTILAVDQRQSSDPIQMFISTNSTGGLGGTDNQELHIGYNDNNTFRFGQWNNDIDAPLIPGYTVDTPSLSTASFDITSGRMIRYQDGSNLYANANGDTTALLTANNGGIGVDTNGFYYTGQLSEIIVFDSALSTEEYLALERYLAAKYNMDYLGIANGADVLTGGDGADTFLWHDGSYSSGANMDSVTDFSGSAGDGDRIALYFDQMINIGGHSGNFASFSGGIGELIWHDNGGGTARVEIDFGGDASGDFAIALDNLADATSLSTDDFYFHRARGTDSGESISGGELDDFLDGGSGDDTLIGNAGDDILMGGVGDDNLQGGAGDDVLYGDFHSSAKLSTPYAGHASLVGWFDANDINGDGSNVTGSIANWTNKAGAFGDATQGIGSAQATVITNELAGQNVLRFDGNDFFDLSSLNALFNGTTNGLTIVAVTANTSNTSGNLVSLQEVQSWATSDHPSLGYDAPNSIRVDGSWGNGHNAGITAGEATTFSVISSVSTTFMGNSIYYNGSLVATNDYITQYNTINSLSIGATRTGANGLTITDYFQGDIAELLIFNDDLSSSDLNSLHEYLGGRYNFDPTYISAADAALDTADVLAGGEGDDTFTWLSTSTSGVGTANRDQITDFKSSSGSYDANELDTIDLTDYALEYIGTDAFTGTANELRVTSSGSDTILEVDSDGNGLVDFEIELTDFSQDLRAEDFIGVTAGETYTVNALANDDSYTGAGGDDELTLTTNNTFGGTDSIDGNNGFDTLILQSGVDIDLNIDSGYIANIEQIDLSAVGSNEVTLSAADLTSITDADNLLFIEGNANDGVTLNGGGWSTAGTQSAYGQDYSVYEHSGGTIQVFIDTDIVITI